MREPVSTMNTSHMATAQAGQLVSLAECREHKMNETIFSDNLDYLEALEREGQLILAQALSRQRGTDWQANPNYVQAMSVAGLTPAESRPERLAELIALTEQQNRQGAALAEQKGVEIYFIKFCRDNKMEGFNRKLLMLLLLLATNERFAEMFDLCNFGEKARNDSAVKIGTILHIICSDYRQQLVNRKSFSIESTLIQQDILQIECDKTSIVERYVSLNDRYVRYFVGDNNIYKSTSTLIQRDNGLVRLDQVIMPEETKQDIVSRVGNYLACRNSEESEMIDTFYGYGTGLTLLFHGPSGTGKTMMAQALACHFNRTLYSLKMSNFRNERYTVVDDAIKDLFLEASLNSGIAYFDEADDFFEKDSCLSGSLLIEIEKARCIVILSTNRPLHLDPALDRRLSMKVCFNIPDAELRCKMWKALMPDFVRLSPHVDFRKLAERYNFTGGLIKNSIFMAVVSSMRSGSSEKSLITMEMIEQACSLQLQQMYDMKDLYQVYTPQCKYGDIPINIGQDIDLKNVANIYQSLKGKKTGLNILVTSSNIQSGIDVVEALANECHLKIKKVNYTDLLKSTNEGSSGAIFDPITQTKKEPMELAFAESTGDAALLMFVDYYGDTKWTENEKSWNGIERRLLYYDLLFNMNQYQGLFCMVSLPAVQKIPRQFNLYFQLEYPPVEIQRRQWKEYLTDGKCCDDELMSLVKNNPMHIAEIDYFAKQALIQAAIEDSSREMTVKDIHKVIERHHKNCSKPPLFGGTNSNYK
ncbi:MAG TPA: AAA family ATPase [Smithella sp.]|nr:AAA family ATPase [Smithella sp.]HOG91604.1 AAA family ATPase [Smithella sp.]HOU50553.1 AAA family ATPase [Smithella sp.]HQG65750.1 AAA family ATPase [Smithella sp.]